MASGTEGVPSLHGLWGLWERMWTLQDSEAEVGVGAWFPSGGQAELKPGPIRPKCSLRLGLNSLCSPCSGALPLRPRQGPHLVSSEVSLQRDPGQRRGGDQVRGGVLGLGLQGPQQGEAQPQEMEGHGCRAEATGQLLSQEAVKEEEE